MKRNTFIWVFAAILFILAGIFCTSIFLGKNIYPILTDNNLMDYFADFFNQIRIVYDENGVYGGGGIFELKKLYRHYNMCC